MWRTLMVGLNGLQIPAQVILSFTEVSPQGCGFHKHYMASMEYFLKY